VHEAGADDFLRLQAGPCRSAASSPAAPSTGDEAPDLDAACALAAQIPDARGGSIEVRPLMVFEP
jgi:hypothetical protein